MLPLDALAECGGVAEWGALRSLGVSRPRLTAEVAAGSVVRVRRGCFALLVADPVRVAEIAWSGTATCVTAAAALGLPVPSSSRVHLAVAAGRSQSGRNLSLPRTIVSHPHPSSQPLTASHLIAHASRCVPRVDLLCIVDAALHRGLITRADIEHLPVSAKLRAWLGLHADGRTQSPLETRARWALSVARIPHGFQVPIDEVGRVDFLVDDWLIVEVDGREHHTAVAAFAADRRRDRAATEHGYRVVRFAYDEVVDSAGFVTAIRAARASSLRPWMTPRLAASA